MKRVISALFFLLFLWVLTAAAAAEVPDWLRRAAKQPEKKYDADVNAVILLDDQITTVTEKGEILHHGRLALKILRPEGRDFGRFPVSFDSDSKINYLRGWSITEKGQEYESKDVFEQGISSYDFYSDQKYKIVRVPGADVGTVLGFEYEQKARPYIFQDFWDFQSFLPVQESRYELHLASSWRFKSDWVNHEAGKPTEEGGALVWRLNDIPRIEREPRRPPSEALAGRMVVTFLSDNAPGKSYRDWGEFGTWYTQLASGVRDPSPALQQKVVEMAPGNMPVLERIKTLARFAQHDVRYVEIRIGVGGWRPHTANDVFTHRYGDCKDKATVLSSMLAQIGVKSYYLLVNTERGVVTEKSPPQAWFNHMILAIALPEASYPKPMPALYEDTKLGHLLIFDPTNDVVPFGQIPSYEQDNYGLLVGEKGGELIHLPATNAESNRVRRTAKFKLLADGTLQGEIEEVQSGFAAMLGRWRLQHESEKDRKKTIETVLGRSLASFQVESFDLVNVDDIDKDLVLHYKFTTDHYAKNAGPLLLVRPRVIGEMAGAWDNSKPRHYAYQFDAPFDLTDDVEISLPEGLKVDELPDPANSKFSFGEYSSKIESAGNVLKYQREYKIKSTLVPTDKLVDLKKLFADITADERNTAVLKKTN